MIAHELCNDRIKVETDRRIGHARRVAGEWGDGERPADVTTRFAERQILALMWEQEAFAVVRRLSEEQAYAALPLIRIGIDIDTLVMS